MYAPFATAIIVASLVAAAWCFVPAARDRFIDRSHLLVVAIVEALIVAQTVIAVVRVIAGSVPVEVVMFFGYLLTTLLLLPAGTALALMERTRWGSVILGSAALVCAVLTLRLLQVWTPLR